jgi:hypothetical protein
MVDQVARFRVDGMAGVMGLDIGDSVRLAQIHGLPDLVMAELLQQAEVGMIAGIKDQRAAETSSESEGP